MQQLHMQSDVASGMFVDVTTGVSVDIASGMFTNVTTGVSVDVASLSRKSNSVVDASSTGYRCN